MPRHLSQTAAAYKASPSVSRRPHLLEMDSASGGTFSDDDMTFFSGMSQPSRGIPKLRSATTSSSFKSAKSHLSLAPSTASSTHDSSIHDNKNLPKKSEEQGSRQSQSRSIECGHIRGLAALSVQESSARGTFLVQESRRGWIATVDRKEAKDQNDSSFERNHRTQLHHQKLTRKGGPRTVADLGTMRSCSWSPTNRNVNRRPTLNSKKNQVIRAPHSTRASMSQSSSAWDTASVASNFFQTTATRKPKLMEPEPELIPSISTGSGSSESSGSSGSSGMMREELNSLSLSHSSSWEGEESDSSFDESPRHEIISPIPVKSKTPRSLFFGLLRKGKRNTKEDEEENEREEDEEEQNEAEEEDVRTTTASGASISIAGSAMDDEVDGKASETVINHEEKLAISKDIYSNMSHIPEETPKVPRLFSTTKKRLGKVSRAKPILTEFPLDNQQQVQTNDGKEERKSCRSKFDITSSKTPKTPKTPTKLSQLFGRRTPTSSNITAGNHTEQGEEDTVAASHASTSTTRLAHLFTRKTPRTAEDDINTSRSTFKQTQFFGLRKSPKVVDSKNDKRGEHGEEREKFQSSALTPFVSEAGDNGEKASSNPKQNDSNAKSADTRNLSRASRKANPARQPVEKPKSKTITVDEAMDTLSRKSLVRIYDPTVPNDPATSNVWNRGRSYLQSKERECQDPRQNLNMVSPTDLQQWLDFAKECIQKANQDIPHDLPLVICDSSLSTAKNMERNCVDPAHENDHSISTIQVLEDETVVVDNLTHDEEPNVLSLQETKTDELLGADSDDADDLRSISSFEVLFNCMTCSILPYNPNYRFNNDDDYFGGQIRASFARVTSYATPGKHLKRVNSLHT